MTALKEILKKKGKTAVWLAKKSNLAEGTIFRFTGNNGVVPAGKTLEKISKALEIPPSEIINWKTPKELNENSSKRTGEDVFKIVENIELPGRHSKGHYLRVKTLKTASALKVGDGFNLPISLGSITFIRSLATHCKKELLEMGIELKSATVIANEKPTGVVIKRIK